MLTRLWERGCDLYATARKKMTLTELVALVSKLPLVGPQIVREAARRSTQRHKCCQCGNVVEVCVGHILEDPAALLTEGGRFRLDISETAVALVSSSDGALTSKAGDVVEPEADASCVDGRSECDSASAEGPSSYYSPAFSPSIDAGGVFQTPSRFACATCGGRLGVHCFVGDATNGDKQVLMQKLFALFNALPEIIPVPPEKVKRIEEGDIFWVD